MNTVIITLIVGIFCASLFEWLLHRFIMHRPFFGLTYPFRTHAQTHHRIFKADLTYHLQDEKDLWTIPMAWWNGPLIISIGSLPFLAASIIFGNYLIVITVLVLFSAYYGTYEYLHWCMHLPLAKRRVIERFWIFYRLNGHHLLHHRYMGKNFNVVLPLADLLFCTLLVRSPVKFAQARGISVPDVQPKTAEQIETLTTS
jgi:hypothetical protein